MATWIVHLRLAENLLNQIDGLDPHYFSIGNVAPDSGIPDERWETFDPPPEILHFKAPESSNWRLADLDFYRQYLGTHKGQNPEPEKFSFLLGYFFHLVTDNLWDKCIGIPTSERFAVEFEADPKFIWQVKRDWYGLDFEYVRREPDSIFWNVFLDCTYDREYLGFLPKGAVQLRLAYIKELYQRVDDEIEAWYITRPGIYLSEDEMNVFIESTTEILYKIYDHFLLRFAELPTSTSALSLDIIWAS
jgi:hypothetical protein